MSNGKNRSLSRSQEAAQGKSISQEKAKIRRGQRSVLDKRNRQSGGKSVSKRKNRSLSRSQ
ncbi:MAG: hypothetical protein ACREOZ_01460, partial [Gloeomargaritales cyanobacterium]